MKYAICCKYNPVYRIQNCFNDVINLILCIVINKREKNEELRNG